MTMMVSVAPISYAPVLGQVVGALLFVAGFVVARNN